MPVVQSGGTLQSFGSSTTVPTVALAPTSSLDQLAPQTYAAIYRTQPYVRTVVDFLAESVAQVGLHMYRRHSDLDRERLADHEVLQWLSDPNPGWTQYRLMASLVQDLGIYGNAYWWKIRRRDRPGLGLVRLSPETITPNGWLLPGSFTWVLPDGRDVLLRPEEVVFFSGYGGLDPCYPIMGLSPLETLRQVLAADAAALSHQRSFYQNSARIDGVIERPREAPKWTPDQKQAWREQWQNRYVGDAAVRTAVLEDGMTYKGIMQSFRESEFTATRKLTREEVASAYQVPLPLVGILEHATYSNIREQHKHLYQDTLGPIFEYVQQEFARQLLVEARDQRDVYFEFNIADKMKGSFEEMSTSLIRTVGRPIMTANEGRARLNLPSIKDDPTADELALPLNTATGNAMAPPPERDRDEGTGTEAHAEMRLEEVA